tara:strand:+ start:43 stop:723 length:681 start_codon:yes stop_codon:yes gene_type:complete
MGIRRGPNIVRDGLVFAVDAANPTSYPGSGTIWKDQTVNQNNGTLTNGPTFDSANQGSVVFDGINDYVTISQTAGAFSQNPMTTEHWVKFDAFNSGGDMLLMDRIAWNGADGIETFILNSPRVVSARGSGGAKHDGSVTISTGVWYHICIVFSGTTAYIYVNGQLDNSGTIGAVQNSTYAMHMGNFPSYSQYNFDGNWATLFIYHKALSATEVLQNYNALKGRFGL